MEQCHKRESENKRLINERKVLTNQLQEEYETRIGQLHLDIVNLRSAKQQLEHELDCLRVDFDHCKSDLESLNSRHKNEVESYRARYVCTEKVPKKFYFIKYIYLHKISRTGSRKIKVCRMAR